MSQLRTMFLLFLLLTLAVSSAEAIEFSYGFNVFEENARPYTYHNITFSETPTAQMPEKENWGTYSLTYWRYFLINDILIRIVNGNDNKPGMIRISDVQHLENLYTLYKSARSGNFLIPGLGNRNNDDGIYLGFTGVGRPVTAVGFIWGSVQTPSECCIQQWFDFSFEDGTKETLIFDYSNNYMGNSTESSSNTFLSFFSKNKPIKSIVINQLGHNPILDEIRIGGLKGDKHIIIDTRDFGTPVKNPAEDIIIQTTKNNQSPEEQTLQNLKDHYGKHAEINKKLSDRYKTELSGLRKEDLFFKYYADRISEATLGIYIILNKLHNDPPRYDYDQITEFDQIDSENIFLNDFGEDFVLFDNLFRMFASNNELLQDSLVTLERLQGAYLDENKVAFDKQADHLAYLWSDSDLSMENLSYLLKNINVFFHNSSFFDLSDDATMSFIEITEQLNSELSKELSNNVFKSNTFSWSLFLPTIISNSRTNK